MTSRLSDLDVGINGFSRSYKQQNMQRELFKMKTKKPSIPSFMIQPPNYVCFAENLHYFLMFQHLIRNQLERDLSEATLLLSEVEALFLNVWCFCFMMAKGSDIKHKPASMMFKGP